jgi:hypothetical protein
MTQHHFLRWTVGKDLPQSPSGPSAPPIPPVNQTASEVSPYAPIDRQMGSPEWEGLFDR